MLTSYPIFAEYHYYMKRWLKTIMTLPRLQAMNPALEIPVTYTSRRAFSIGSSTSTGGDAGGDYLYAPPNQGNNFLPIVTFRYTNATPIYDRTIPYEHIFKKFTKDNNNSAQYKLNKPMLVYELYYTAYMYCALMQDCDILSFRLMSEFRPQCQVWLGDIGDCPDREKGLYAHMVLESVTDGTEYEPADIAERVVRKDFSWKITEAYVPTIPHKIDDKIIKEVYTDIYEG